MSNSIIPVDSILSVLSTSSWEEQEALLQNADEKTKVVIERWREERSLLRLPNEGIDLIIQYLPKREQQSLAVTCTQLNACVIGLRQHEELAGIKSNLDGWYADLVCLKEQLDPEKHATHLQNLQHCRDTFPEPQTITSSAEFYALEIKLKELFADILEDFTPNQVRNKLFGGQPSHFVESAMSLAQLCAHLKSLDGRNIDLLQFKSNIVLLVQLGHEEKALRLADSMRDVPNGPQYQSVARKTIAKCLFGCKKIDEALSVMHTINNEGTKAILLQVFIRELAKEITQCERAIELWFLFDELADHLVQEPLVAIIQTLLQHEKHDRALELVQPPQPEQLSEIIQLLAYTGKAPNLNFVLKLIRLFPPEREDLIAEARRVLNLGIMLQVMQDL